MDDRENTAWAYMADIYRRDFSRRVRNYGKRRWQEAAARDDGKRLRQRGYGKRLQTDIIRKRQSEIIRKDQERTAAII